MSSSLTTGVTGKVGEPSEAGLYLDGQAAYDFLVNIRNIPWEKIVPFGRSLGAAVAIELSLDKGNEVPDY